MKELNLEDYGWEGRPLDDFLVIDAHAHSCPRAETDFEIDIENGMLKDMDRIGIDITAISSFVALDSDMRMGNDRVEEIVNKHPDRFIGYAHINPAYPDLIDAEMNRCLENEAFVGLKLHLMQDFDYRDQRFEPVWEFADQNQLPILVHTWGKQVLFLKDIIPEYKGATFLLAHSGSDGYGTPYIEIASKNENTYIDLTYSRPHNWMVERFVKEVGASRVLFGSDSLLFSSAHQIGKVLFARISEDDKLKIMGKNARKLFSL